MIPPGETITSLPDKFREATRPLGDISLGKAGLRMEQKRSATLGFDNGVAEIFSQTLLKSGYDRPEHSKELAVAKLRSYDPAVLMVDLDHLRNDKLESVRQVRFVLPDCAIAVISSDLKRSWARRCHFAGATCVLAGGQSAEKLLAGLKRGIATGCYTDAAFGDDTHNGKRA